MSHLRKFLLCIGLVMTLGSTAALQAETFAQAVLAERAKDHSLADARQALYDVRDRHPGCMEKFRNYLGMWDDRPYHFFQKGEHVGLENKLLSIWLERLESLYGSGNCAGSRAAVEAVATVGGDAGVVQRLDLLQQMVDLVKADARLRAVSLNFSKLSLERLAEKRAPSWDALEKRLQALEAPFSAVREQLNEAAASGTAGELESLAALADRARPVAVEALREALVAGGCEEVVFAVRSHHEKGHFYESIGYYGPDGEYLYSKRGGRLVVWNLRTGKTRDLLTDPGGAVRDPCVSWDGQTIVFSYRPTGSHYYHLYKIFNDGSGLEQMTFGEWNDIEPTWVPDGGVVFTSTRCHRWIPCNMAEVTNLHRCDADGSNIRMISSNVETETAPWMLPDGRIAYMRWEYTEKDRAKFHTLWTVNPDGTNHQLLFGNEPTLTDVWNDPKPVPGTDQIVFIAHNHGGAEHAGHVGIVDQYGGPNDHRRILYLTAPYRAVSEPWRDPFPITKDLILAARGPALVVLDQDGHEIELFRLEDESLMLHEPRKFGPTERPRELPKRVDYAKDHGTFFISDVYHGRQMEGIERGDVKDILLIEELPKPVHHEGHTEPLMYNGTFMLEKVLGTVPVEPDGSAYFNAPPLRSLMLVLRDEDGLSLKRMQSFATLMPGEVQSCTGCHESRTELPMTKSYPLAAMRAPSEIRMPDGIPEVYDYTRDIQPIIDRNCLACHDRETRQDGVVLDGDRELWFSQSYVTLHALDQIGMGRRALDAGMAPREVGSSASGFLEKLIERHEGIEPTPHEIEMVKFWIDSGAVWAGTYAAVNTTRYADVTRDPKLMPVIESRCAPCHAPHGSNFSKHVLLRQNSPNFGPDPNERYGVRINLDDIDRSMMLLGPLAKEAGGFELCLDDAKQPLASFTSREDPDFVQLRERIIEIRDEAMPYRYDREGFRPLPTYVREMKRQGLLPVDFDAANDPWDPYALDEAFWRSFWHEPKNGGVALNSESAPAKHSH